MPEGGAVSRAAPPRRAQRLKLTAYRQQQEMRC
jgi:hypothetical protein